MTDVAVPQCDEGGVHEFVQPHSVGWTDYITCFLCAPCYACCSCLFSGGAAFANPVFEQTFNCAGSGADAALAGHDTVCRKCGLTLFEARSLYEARRNEAFGVETNRPAGYFSADLSQPMVSHR